VYIWLPCITCTETRIIPFKFLVTNVMYIFVNLRKLKKKKQRRKKSPTQSTIWMNRSYDNFKVIKLVCLCETGFSPSKSALKMASHSSAIHKKVSTICNFMVSNSFLISKIWIYRLIHGTSKARSLDPLDYISTSLF
jgi:hypothetical protein